MQAASRIWSSALYASYAAKGPKGKLRMHDEQRRWRLVAAALGLPLASVQWALKTSHAQNGLLPVRHPPSQPAYGLSLRHVNWHRCQSALASNRHAKA